MVKRISQNLTTGEIKVSMEEYHKSIQTVRIPVKRKQSDAPLMPSELKQLRAILGSLQWLVAQVRFDQAFALSTLQGERPTIATLMKANLLVKRFKELPTFSLVFKPMDLADAGTLVVSDSSLGNVQLSGVSNGSPMEKVYSQS